MRDSPGHPPPDCPSAARQAPAHNTEKSTSRLLWDRGRELRESIKNWAAGEAPRIIATRAVEAGESAGSVSGGAQGPRSRALSSRAALRPQELGLLTPEQRPGAGKHHTGPATSAAPQASSGPRAAGPARELSAAGHGHCRRPAGGHGTGLTKSSGEALTGNTAACPRLTCSSSCGGRETSSRWPDVGRSGSGAAREHWGLSTQREAPRQHARGSRASKAAR